MIHSSFVWVAKNVLITFLSYLSHWCKIKPMLLSDNFLKKGFGVDSLQTIKSFIFILVWIKYINQFIIVHYPTYSISFQFGFKTSSMLYSFIVQTQLQSFKRNIPWTFAITGSVTTRGRYANIVCYSDLSKVHFFENWLLSAIFITCRVLTLI